MLLVIDTTAALAYQPGTLGDDISFPQCGRPYPTSSGSFRAAPPRVTTTAVPTWRSRLAGAPVSAPQPATTPPARTAPIPQAVKAGSALSFGIVGVDSGNPFISAAHPGNPCLADEYRHTPNPALYVNTGYDPSYVNPDHTLPD